MQNGLELSGQEFLELIDELAHECNVGDVKLPHEVVVTSYRRCNIRSIDIPNKWVVGKRLMLQVTEKTCSCHETCPCKKREVMYHYSIPVGVRPGQKNILVCGLSEEKVEPNEKITFGSIDACELAHWLCYHQGNARFPFDPDEKTQVSTKATQEQCSCNNRLNSFYYFIPFLIVFS